MNKKFDIEESSGNIFKDLGFENADEMHIKSSLAITVLQTIKIRQLTQEQTAELLGTHRTHLSRLNNGVDIDNMSIDLLMSWVIKLGGNVTIKVKSPPKVYEHSGKMRIAITD